MVFKNRNQSYGAYILRKEYPAALAASVVFMMVVMLLIFALSPFAIKVFKKLGAGDKVQKKVIYIIEPPEDMMKPRTQQRK